MWIHYQSKTCNDSTIYADGLDLYVSIVSLFPVMRSRLSFLGM